MAALVVEDGTGLANADSYVSVSEANRYHEDIGTPAASWENLDDDDVKAPALRRATKYLIQEYRKLWAGYRVTATQSLDWPRNDVQSPDLVGFDDVYSNWYPNNVVPPEVKNACCELALKATLGELSPDLTPPVIREKVGPIETEYAVGSRQYTRYPAIENMLSPFLNSSGNSIALHRA